MATISQNPNHSCSVPGPTGVTSSFACNVKESKMVLKKKQKKNKTDSTWYRI